MFNRKRKRVGETTCSKTETKQRVIYVLSTGTIIGFLRAVSNIHRNPRDSFIIHKNTTNFTVKRVRFKYELKHRTLDYRLNLERRVHINNTTCAGHQILSLTNTIKLLRLSSSMVPALPPHSFGNMSIGYSSCKLSDVALNMIWKTKRRTVRVIFCFHGDQNRRRLFVCLYNSLDPYTFAGKNV